MVLRLYRDLDPCLRFLFSGDHFVQWGGGGGKEIAPRKNSNRGELLDQLSEGQKAFESFFFHTVTLQKPQITEFLQILSHLAQTYF